MDDLISRKAAIEVAESHRVERPGFHLNDYEYGRDQVASSIASDLEDLPLVQQWIPCSERLPSKKERKEWIDKHLGGIGYLYPCLVTRYSSISPERTNNNPYVAKHYFDGYDFLNNDEEVCSDFVLAWMPLPEPYTEEES